MATDIVKQIRKATRRKSSADEKIRIVLEGLRGEIPIGAIWLWMSVHLSLRASDFLIPVSPKQSSRKAGDA